MRTYDDPVIAGFRPDPSVCRFLTPWATAAGLNRPGRAGLSGRLDGAYHHDIGAAGIGPVRQCLARRTVEPGPVTLTVEVRTDSPVSPTAREEPGVRAGGPGAVALGIDGVRLSELDGR